MNGSERFFLKDSIRSAATAAMLLALTRTIADEENVKRILSDLGYKFVVTEVGGSSAPSEFQTKSTRAVMGACLNNGLIPREAPSVHALLHATEEAKRGLLISVVSNVSIAVKVAIATDATWIAVAMFGQSSYHPLAEHERAGLGVMHLGREL